MKDIKVKLIVLCCCLAATFILFVYVVHTMPPDDEPVGNVTVQPSKAVQRAALRAKQEAMARAEAQLATLEKETGKKDKENIKWKTFYGPDPSLFYIEPKYKRGDTLHVFAFNGLKLRVAPEPDAEAAVTIPYGEMVTVLDGALSGKVTSAGWNRGKWIFVRWSGEQGYIFDSHLSRLPAPEIQSRLYYDRLPDGVSYAMILKRYANEVLIPNEHASDFTFEASHQNHKGYRLTKITFDGVRVMDVYHLAEALIKNTPCGEKNLKNLCYVKDKTGKLRKIQSSRSPIRITCTGKDTINLIMKH